ncbi:hypothetical protein BHE74_00022687, partial [Ensete ventricosum]
DDDDDDDDDDGRRHAGSAIALADCPRHVLLLPLHRPFPCSCHLTLHVPASCRVAIECFDACGGGGWGESPEVPHGLYTTRIHATFRSGLSLFLAKRKGRIPLKILLLFGSMCNSRSVQSGHHSESREGGSLCAVEKPCIIQTHHSRYVPESPCWFPWNRTDASSSITRELRSTLLSYLLAEYGVGLIQNGLPILHLPEHEAQEADEEEEEDDDGFLEVILLYVDAVDDSEVPTVKYGYRKKMVMIDGSCSLALWIERDMADGG